jgi:Cu/Ag efflux protein CusF
MKRITSTFTAFAITTALIGTPSAFAMQDPAPQPAPERQEQRQQATTATGELTSVDPEAMTLTIKAADGKAWTFRYTADTEVSGAQAGVAGLATQAGTVVTVHFEGEDEARTATKIEVAE